MAQRIQIAWAIRQCELANLPPLDCNISMFIRSQQGLPCVWTDQFGSEGVTMSEPMTEWELAVYIRESIPGKLWYVDIFSGTWKATVGPIVDRDAAVGCADKFNHSYGRLRSAPIITVKSARDDDDKFYGGLAPAQPAQCDVIAKENDVEQWLESYLKEHGVQAVQLHWAGQPTTLNELLTAYAQHKTLELEATLASRPRTVGGEYA